ncbi:MAG: tRNA (adenosine(37)-N6)-dimethylallyltransferase MiaA [Planctomycetes bacterium]|nr:tRNA (adenosine(37)-N6)-dimethylallyltransferase MiaA [Planctomycetota bacterium]MCA8935772.1 tRNA (adenosine(37)-N6)-dimethylallyltransferase MiaA [Planctomycetota bacterium]
MDDLLKLIDHDHLGPSVVAKFPVLVVLGPTASGKSRLAMHVAERVGGEILSVDALKVYRGMDVGTAKPTATELARIPHHGIDLVGADEEFSVSEFLDYAEPVIAEIVSRKRVPVLDATAPYYLKALVYGIDRGPEPRPEFRDEMEQRPLADVYEELKRKDPASAQRIGPTDQRRLVRALEIIEFGEKLPSEVDLWGEPRGDYRWVFTGIRWPRDILYRRVKARAEAMFEQGWLHEVQTILAGKGFSTTSGKAHGYRRLQQYIAGELTFEECVEETIRDVKTFARKSMTFFKTFPKVQWLDVTIDEEIDRAGAYLAHELKDMLTQCGVPRDMIDLP